MNVSCYLLACKKLVSLLRAFLRPYCKFGGFPDGSDGKESACSVGDLGSVPGLGRSPGGGNGNPLQYSCLENPHGQRSLEGYSLWILRVGQDSATKHSTVSSGMGLQRGTRLEQA